MKRITVVEHFKCEGQYAQRPADAQLNKGRIYVYGLGVNNNKIYTSFDANENELGRMNHLINERGVEMWYTYT